MVVTVFHEVSYLTPIAFESRQAISPVVRLQSLPKKPAARTPGRPADSISGPMTVRSGKWTPETKYGIRSVSFIPAIPLPDTTPTDAVSLALLGRTNRHAR